MSAQTPLFDGPTAPQGGPRPCAWEGCGRVLHRGGVNGMHADCARKAERAADPSTDIYKRLAAHWAREFKRVRGEDPIWSGKDRGALKKAATELVPQVGEPRVLTMITVALEGGHSLSYLANEPNAFVGKRPARGAQRVIQGRPNGVR